ncbi:hypothetical protein GOP47_0001268 [Adiantum capillus-veneris]|uniref:PPC domain-containing protein n=1 Tax=Adiantum capillus-veneris TaxID=13818 RepID=A0A9D4VFG7_ADICA|nr:hypothetical protein GOP47_0001268 [Adiantum capillus-veneris]
MAGLDQGSPPHHVHHLFQASSFPHLQHHSQFPNSSQSHRSTYSSNDQQQVGQSDQHHHHLQQQYHQHRLQLHNRHLQQALDPAHIHQTLQEQEHLQQALQEHEEQQLQQYNSQHESQSSEEEEISSSGQRSKKKAKKGGGGGDSHGEVLHMGKRPRGRPPGSKNKPKPPLIITQDSEDAMRPHILEVAGGCDVAECLANFARRRQRGICLLTGSGTVANVTLRQPLAEGATVTFHGRFEILSLSGCYLPSPVIPGGLTISLAGSQGQVVGGSVVGELLAASPVLIIAASFLSAPYERLPMANEEDDQSNLMAHSHGITSLNMNTSPSNHPMQPSHSHSHSPLMASSNPPSTNHPNPKNVTNLNINTLPTPPSNHIVNNLNMNATPTTININAPSTQSININGSSSSLASYIHREQPTNSESNMHSLFNPPMIAPLNCQLPQEVLAWAAVSTNPNAPPHHFMQ